eukprot:1472199-Prymnesium_polylepis.1
MPDPRRAARPPPQAPSPKSPEASWWTSTAAVALRTRARGARSVRPSSCRAMWGGAAGARVGGVA